MADNIAVCVSVKLMNTSSTTGNHALVTNRITKFPVKDTFTVCFQHFVKSRSLTEVRNEVNRELKILVASSAKASADDWFDVDPEDRIETAKQFTCTDVMFIKSQVSYPDKALTHASQKNAPNAFTVLMQTGFKVLDPIPEANKKCELHNAVLKDIQQNGQILRSHVSQKEGTKVVQAVTDVIWYLDGRQDTIKEAVRIRGHTNVTPLPTRLEKYVGYQDWINWKKKPRIEQDQCTQFAESLLAVADKLIIKWPQEWHKDIITAASTLSSYAHYLKEANVTQQARQLQMNPIREISTLAVFQYCPEIPADKLHDRYTLLSGQMVKQAECEPLQIDVDEHVAGPMNASKKHHYLQNIALTVPVLHFRYDPGGGSSTLHFLYKISTDLDESERLTLATRMLAKLEPKIPVYHTRAMRKSFYKETSTLHGTDLHPHILRHLYRTLTGDSSAELQCAEIDSRVKVAVETEDADLVLDLRHLNKGRPEDTFAVFFTALEKLVDELTAAADRRHGVSYMSEFLSIRDLIQQVKERIPDGSPIPSESTVIYSFAPANMYDRSSQYYTGRVNLKHAIQRRQLRAYHTDAHWCNAQLRYLRELAIRHRDHSLFLSCDDKAKVDFGEPGTALSSGVRGKKSIIPTTSFLGALDHDMNQKGSITPTVVMSCDIPEDISESFYKGKVCVSLKDSVYQPSSSFRTVCETIKAVTETCQKTENNVEYLFIVTDGGPEHRVNFDSVKIPLICMFKKLDLEMLVAVRTAPGHSYVNVVERVMSILNIGFQNVALEREACASDDTIRKCKNLDELRKHPEIRDDWNQSLEPLLEKLKARMSRLKLKDVPFTVLAPATEDEVAGLVESSAEIDSSLPNLHKAKKLTKADLASKKSYQSYLDQHCRQGHYVFQIRKCSDPECCSNPPPEKVDWLPYPVPDETRPGHYKPFSEVCGLADTSEESMPSRQDCVRKVAAEQQGCLSSTLTAQNIRDVINCSDCNKPRCIYANKKLTDRDTRELRTIVRRYDYTCGCLITPDVSTLGGVVFTRLEINCASPIEWAYYNSPKGRSDICAHCGVAGAAVEAELKRIYKSVLPLCEACKGKGKQSLKRRPVATAAAKKAVKRKK